MKSPSNKKPMLLHTSPFSALPEDTLLLIFSFCDASTLFFTIPFINLQIRHILKKPEESNNSTTHPANANSKQLLYRLTMVKENQIWKMRLLREISEYSMIQNDSLYVYKRLYFLQLQPPKPVHAQQFKFQEMIQQLQDMIAMSLLDSESLLQKQQAHLKIKQTEREKRSKKVKYTPGTSAFLQRAEENHKKLLTREVGKLLKDAKAVADSLNQKSGETKSSDLRNSLDAAVEYKGMFKRYQEVIRFLMKTAIVESTLDKALDDMNLALDHRRSIQLLSPVNGNTVTMEIRISQYAKMYSAERLEWLDTSFTVTVIQRDAMHHVKDYPVDLDKREWVPRDIWPMAVHLGLDELFPRAAERVELLFCMWDDIIQHCFGDLALGGHEVVQYNGDFESALERSGAYSQKKYDKLPESLRKEYEQDYEKECQEALEPK